MTPSSPADNGIDDTAEGPQHGSKHHATGRPCDWPLLCGNYAGCQSLPGSIIRIFQRQTGKVCTWTWQ